MIGDSVRLCSVSGSELKRRRPAVLERDASGGFVQAAEAEGLAAGSSGGGGSRCSEVWRPDRDAASGGGDAGTKAARRGRRRRRITRQPGDGSRSKGSKKFNGDGSAVNGENCRCLRKEGDELIGSQEKELDDDGVDGWA
ncbi:uncharacterized protein A4U43_C05F22320 [Asparagus officinalis]|uniref:Uncharacterized protein n=1 Tax=Asparagus officinalis TaxID=4686 RepID=A0A5P1EW39_ASPOF|nr:uncharacterized protein A4U43_C05F22320 [Asparagus officinalis]